MGKPLFNHDTDEVGYRQVSVYLLHHSNGKEKIEHFGSWYNLDYLHIYWLLQNESR